MLSNVFVTGTDTDVGKTYISAALAWAAKGQVTYWKPIQTGLPDEDQMVIKNLAPDTPIHAQQWSFRLAASPDQAAIYEGKVAPSLDNLLHSLNSIENPCIIEGAGGIQVPLNNSAQTWLDFLKESALEVILVARTGLGTLNHCSLSIHLLELNRIPIRGVILSGPRHKANEQSLRRMHPKVNFLHFPEAEPLSEAWQSSAQSIWQSLKNLKEPTASSLANDQKHCWHPYTQHKNADSPVEIIRAKGPWLFTSAGERLMDGSSSWWANTIGHGRSEIAKAIHSQQQQLDHVLFAGTAHSGATELARRLSAYTEHQLPKVFFTDNGSCAVEVGLKMAIQKAVNEGETQRTKILSIKGSYHGDTFGAMSVGGSDDFHSSFSAFTFQSLKVSPVSAHPSNLCPEGSEAMDRELDKLAQLLAQEHQNLAAVLVEPLVLGAAGMVAQHIPWLQAFCQLVNQYQVPLIFDEVFTGMGRCGALFAYQKLGLNPDIICIAKGLTGGNLPLAATLAKDHIFEAFFHDDRSKALHHGHTFTANAICCAAALASLDIYEQENLVAQAQALEASFLSWVERNTKELSLQNPRAIGAILAWELPSSAGHQYFHSAAQSFPKIARKHGLLLRTLGNTVYFVPPLNLSKEELIFALDALAKSTLEWLNKERPQP